MRVERRVPSLFFFFPDSLFLLSKTNPIPPNQPPMVFRTDCLYSPSRCILVTNSHALTTVEDIVRRNRRSSTLLTNIFFFSLHLSHSNSPETSIDSWRCSKFGSAWKEGWDYSRGKVGWLAWLFRLENVGQVAKCEVNNGAFLPSFLLFWSFCREGEKSNSGLRAELISFEVKNQYIYIQSR